MGESAHADSLTVQTVGGCQGSSGSLPGSHLVGPVAQAGHGQDCEVESLAESFESRGDCSVVWEGR